MECEAIDELLSLITENRQPLSALRGRLVPYDNADWRIYVVILSALDPTGRMFRSRLDRVRNYLHLEVKTYCLIPIYLAALFGFLTISLLPLCLCARCHDNLELKNIKQSERKGKASETREIILIVISRTAIPAAAPQS
jgi:hypothetical protein